MVLRQRSRGQQQQEVGSDATTPDRARRHGNGGHHGVVGPGDHQRRADRGRHPYVGLAVFDDADGPSYRCSASLLSPTVVLTAGHCTDGAVTARVWFAEDVQNNSEYPFSGATSYDGTPYTYPDFCIGCGKGLPGFAQRHVGVIVLSEPVSTSVVSRYAQLPSVGLVDDLSKKAPVTLVGYGMQERIVGGGPPVWAGLRVRLMAPAWLVSGSFTHSDEFVRVTASPGQVAAPASATPAVPS